MSARLRIVRPGFSATVQDLGRAGLAHLGVSRSGALDRGALRLANRLVGNLEGAAGLELTVGGFRAAATADLWAAVTGAGGGLTLDGRDLDPFRAFAWPAGAELQVQPFTAGLRGYLAVRGGIAVPRSAGSRATDTLAGLGPAPLRDGDELPVGAETDGPVPPADLVPWTAARVDEVEVELAPGPREGWFAASALRLLFEERWTVTSQADRVGVRLDGPELTRAVAGELPSEGMVPGALQVPPSGRPVVLLADGPVTGGYPVIAVVTDAALDLFAQLRPGTGIRFRHAHGP